VQHGEIAVGRLGEPGLHQLDGRADGGTAEGGTLRIAWRLGS